MGANVKPETVRIQINCECCGNEIHDDVYDLFGIDLKEIFEKIEKEEKCIFTRFGKGQCEVFCYCDEECWKKDNPKDDFWDKVKYGKLDFAMNDAECMIYAD